MTPTITAIPITLLSSRDENLPPDLRLAASLYLPFGHRRQSTATTSSSQT
jgi:hypothetical protein